MAINYVNQKCNSCASTNFDYDKETNLWICQYCGAKVERHEELDTLFSIKNVVRQTLVDLAYDRLDDAQRNLVECEKIDSRYVGTIIAKICFYISSSKCAANESELRNSIAQVQKYYTLLCEKGDSPKEEEIILYEFLDSAEATGVLILSYDTIGVTERRDLLLKNFKAKEVYSMSLNTNLFRFMLSSENYDVVDQIVTNTANLDKKSTITELLSDYPDNEQKAENCCLLIKEDALSEDDSFIFEEYLRTSNDSVDTKAAIMTAACKTYAAPSVSLVMEYIITQTETPEVIRSIIDSITSKKLGDSQINAITEYAFYQCKPDAVKYILKKLKDTNQFVVVGAKPLIALLSNTEASAEDRKNIVATCLELNVNNKTKEQIVASYLCDVEEDFSNRKPLLEYLLSIVDAISTVSVEKYLVSVTADGENKAEVVSMIFATNINKSFFRGIFDKYITSATDSPEVIDKVIHALSEAGLKPTEKACADFIAGASSDERKLDVLNTLKSNGYGASNVLDRYLSTVAPNAFSPQIMAELMSDSSVVSVNSFMRFLLCMKYSDATKATIAAQLAESSNIHPESIGCIVTINGYRVECNLMQGYLLTTPDTLTAAQSVINALGANRSKLTSDVIVLGIRKKFKKYVHENQGCLGETPRELISSIKL